MHNQKELTTVANALWGISPDLLREQYDTQLVSNVVQKEVLPDSSISRTSQLCSVNSYHE